MDKKFLKEVIRVFVFAFIGTFLSLIQGIWIAPDWNAQKALLASALIGAISAGVKALTDFLTKGVQPAPNVGVLSSSVKD